jgi:hypothetical protein
MARGAVLLPEVAEKEWQWSRDSEAFAKIDIRQETDPFHIVTRAGSARRRLISICSAVTSL